MLSADFYNCIYLLFKFAIGVMAAMWFWEHVLSNRVDKWLSENFEDEE